MTRFVTVLALLTSMSQTTMAHPLRQPSAGELARSVERLGVVGNVLYVAAHPDDENTRLLTWLTRDQKIRAGYLSLTRGEGGQNLIGPEQAPLLGVIRTQELLAARGVDGAEQLFGRQRDFGYSKTPEETLALWGKSESLGDVVWAIRRFHPDVIVTRFSPEARDTHGHHTASAILALEAFKAAADPKAFPEQLQWVKPWQAKRIVWNKGIFPGMVAKPDELKGFVAMDVSGYDALLGVSYGELAARSRSMHKSQGFGSSPSRGPASEYFQVLAGEPMQRSFLDGVDLGWARVPGSDKLRALLTRARTELDSRKPWASLPLLLDAKDALDALPDNPWKADKQAELAEVLAGASGLYVEAVTADPLLSATVSTKLNLSVLNRSPTGLHLSSVKVLGGVADLPSVELPLVTGAPQMLTGQVVLARALTSSQPYWLVDPPTPGRWTVNDQTLVGRPENPPLLQVELGLQLGQRSFMLRRDVDFSITDPVAGERRRQPEVLPAVTVQLATQLLVFPDTKSKELRLTVQSSRGAVAGELAPKMPAGFTVTPPKLPYTLGETGAIAELSFTVHPPRSGAVGVVGFAVADADAHSVVRLDYPHIPPQLVTPRCEVKLVRADIKREVTRVGYIMGPGDEVPGALRQAGYEVTLLTDEALGQSLDHYQAIVVGVRAFNTNPKLPKAQPHLLAWVEAGGILLVQYNTQNRISKLAGQIGPHPFRISQERVTEENATVEKLDPKHPVFLRPNVIGDADFVGWVQERGLYFADQWDEKYTPLLSMHDAGEPARKGSLLWTRVGKGVFVYTGLALFRQLPAGVPGAYRLLANLLSHGH